MRLPEVPQHTRFPRADGWGRQCGHSSEALKWIISWLFPGPQTTGRAQTAKLNCLEQWDLAGNLEIYGGLFLVVITIAGGVLGTVAVNLCP